MWALPLLLALLPAVIKAQYTDSPCETSIYERQHPLRETRAVWLTTIGGLDWPRTKVTDATSRMRQQEELIRILDNYQRANINTVIFQTRVRAALLYPSKIEPWELSLTGQAGKSPGYDPLAFCIEECHKRGMTVLLDLVFNHTSDQHEWFESCYAAHVRNRPQDQYYT
ncbi:MAG: family 10 glycosylhydrolase, partial [Bacteroidaceae bacterium]|nr:family 10 glycosylhydrolase [Bacteroidaceae bacterium]